MKEFFGEKSHQTEPSALEAFGVTIQSRYGHAHELIELMNFQHGNTRSLGARRLDLPVGQGSVSDTTRRFPTASA